MKNIVKLTLVAFIALLFAACKGTQSTSTSDTTKAATDTTKAAADTMKKDTGMKKDTTKMADSTKKP